VYDKSPPLDTSQNIASACPSACVHVTLIVRVAVQNERDRISVRRASCNDLTQSAALSVASLLSAELLSRQVGCTPVQLILCLSLCLLDVRFHRVTSACDAEKVSFRLPCNNGHLLRFK